MIDFGASFLYKLAKDLYAWFKGRNLSPSEILRLREKWKKEFEGKLLDWQKAGICREVIIRDMKRVDEYPNVNEKEKGISSWFKLELMDTYHKGIQVGLRWDNLTKCENSNQWRHTNYKAGETGDIKVILIGYIPYENIESVDWEGDEYYPSPHIYCYFDNKKEPYEMVAYCEEKHLDDFPFYSKIVDYGDVQNYLETDREL